jgi:hypothetical protein
MVKHLEKCDVSASGHSGRDYRDPEAKDGNLQNTSLCLRYRQSLPGMTSLGLAEAT